MNTSNLTHATKETPCPVCGHTDWCYHFEDSQLHVCKRAEIAPDGWFRTKQVDREGHPYFASQSGEYRTVSYAPTKKSNDLSSSERDRGYGIVSQLFGDFDAACLEEIGKRKLNLTETHRIRSLNWLLPWTPHILVPEETPLNLPGVSLATNKTISYDGLAIASVNLAGEILGYQVRPSAEKDRKDGKYKAVSGGAGSSWNLANGEQPITIWQHKHLDHKSEATTTLLLFIEGYLKSLIVALFLWRAGLTNIVVVGVPGCNFGSHRNQINDVLSAFPSAEYVLAPDSGSINNTTVLRGYRSLHDLIPSLNILWWDQYTKVPDGDDLDDLLRRSKRDFAAIDRHPWDKTPLGKKADSEAGLDEAQEMKFREKFYNEKKVFKHDLTIYQEKLSLSGEYLPQLDKEKRIIAIKSYFGSGKTHSMIEIAKVAEKLKTPIHVVGSRNNLGIQTSKRIYDTIPNTFHLRKDFDNEYCYQHFADDSTNLVYCIDALEKVSNDCLEGKIVILDEVVSVLIHLLTSSTMAKRRPAVLAKFSHLLRHAHTIYLLDANLNDWAVKVVSKLANENNDDEFSLIKIENGYVLNNKLDIHFVAKSSEEVDRPLEDSESEEQSEKSDFSYHPLVAKILKACNPKLSNFERILIVTDSKKYAERQDRLMKRRGAKGKVISSTTSDANSKYFECKNEDDWKALMEEDQLDYLICTPSVESGLSIDLHDYFDKVYCFFFGIISVDTCLQMLFRLRDFNCPRFVWASSRGFANSPKYNGIKSPTDIMEALRYDLILAGEDCYSIIKSLHLDGLRENIYNRAWADAVVIDCYEKYSYRETLSHRLSNDLNLNYSVLDISDIDDTATKAEIEEDSKQQEKIKLTALLIAPAIAEKDVKSIKKQPSQSIEDEAKLERYYIEKTFPDITESESWKYDPSSKVTQPLSKILNKDIRKMVTRQWLIQNREVGKSILNDELLATANRASIDIESDLTLIRQIEYLGISDLLQTASSKILAINEDHPLIQSISKKSRMENLKSTKLHRSYKCEVNQYVSKVLSKIGYQWENIQVKGEKRIYYAIPIKSQEVSDLYAAYEAGLRVRYPSYFAPNLADFGGEPSQGEKMAESVAASGVDAVATCGVFGIVKEGEGATLSFAKKSSDSERTQNQLARGASIIRPAEVLHKTPQNNPHTIERERVEVPAKDTEYQLSQIPTSQTEVKPAPSLACGVSVAHHDIYHTHGNDLGTIERIDDWAVFVNWEDGTAGRYSADELIPLAVAAGSITDYGTVPPSLTPSSPISHPLPNLLSDALKSGWQGVKGAVDELVSQWGDIAVLAAAYLLPQSDRQKVRMLL